jgi:hypothetical protein
MAFGFSPGKLMLGKHFVVPELKIAEVAHSV